MQLRSQAFTVEEEFGTIVSLPTQPVPATDIALPIATIAISEDPLARLERKLDTALRQIERLQQRIESLDITLARTLSR